MEDVARLAGVSRRRFFEGQPLRRRVDALIAVAMQLSDAESAVLRGLGVPMVLIGDALPGAASVRIDDLAGARLAAGHLTMLGHRRIGMITTYVDESPWPRVDRDRRQGYFDVLGEAGLAADPRLVVSIPHGMKGGRAAMNRLLALDDPPTGVVAESDELAFGALAALRHAGIGVPGGMSIVGFDDHELSELLELTTIRQSVFAQGVLAAHLLDRALREPGWEPVDIQVPTTLVVRSTTAALR